MIKVLIVDDSLIARRNMEKFLKNLGCEVMDQARNGVEAVEKAARLKPDLITMDITMPDMDGIEAVKLIKQNDANAKIIMATSHGQEQMVLSSIKAGARGYMLKPVTQDKLQAVLEKTFPELKQGFKARKSSSDDIEVLYSNDN